MRNSGKIKENILNAGILVVLFFVFGTPAYANVTASPTSVNFGNQAVGTTSAPTQVTVTFSSTRRWGIQIVSASLSPVQYSYSGPSLPITLHRGQSATFSVTFAPTAAQAYAGKLVFTFGNGSTIAVTMTGTGVQAAAQTQPPTITTPPSSQTVTAGQTATFTVAATGTSPMAYQWKKNGAAISGATSSTYTTPATTSADNGSQFSAMISNIAGSAASTAALLTVNGAPGCVQSSSTAWKNTAFPTQTAPFMVTFDATPSQAKMDGVVGFSLNAATGYTNLAAITRFSSASGNIDAINGANYAADVVVPYAAGLTYHFRVVIDPTNRHYSAYVTPPGSLEIALAANYAFRAEQATLSSFNNWGTYSEIGSETVCNLVLGSAPAPTPVAPKITTQPASKTVIAGQTATFTVGATGTSPLTYQWMKNGTAINGATSSTYTTPATTTSDNAAQFTVGVTNSAGSATSSAATLTVNAATALLNTSSTALSFGSVALSTTSSQNVTLTNAGNSNITISGVSVSGAGFNASGVSTGLILTPGQTATLSATFTPAATGSVSGSVTVSSNATNSPNTIALSGTGLAQVNHSVSLSWTPSTSSVMGYHSYSSTKSGGPYVKLTMTPVPTTTYTDTTVQTGLTYYYVVTAVDSNNMESTFSTETSAIVP